MDSWWWRALNSLVVTSSEGGSVVRVAVDFELSVAPKGDVSSALSTGELDSANMEVDGGWVKLAAERLEVRSGDRVAVQLCPEGEMMTGALCVTRAGEATELTAS